MANINQAIRYYQPNDPYYWEVDNLPLTDLLGNDVILQERIAALEDTVNGLGSGSKGAFSFAALSDLKAYVEPTSGTPSNWGRIYVRPGKFTARMQLPASRESGWRMMRDDDGLFNNSDLNGFGGLNTTTLTDDFVRSTKGLARTSVVEFYPNVDNTDKFIEIPSFDPTEFNSAAAPEERLDLIYIKATAALDTNYEVNAIPEASIGIIKGAYFRTDAAAGIKAIGQRFTDGISRDAGRITGMASTEIPATARLSTFGSVPSPDDLTNFAWHTNQSTSDWDNLVQQQVDTQAAFCMPVAYLRVPAGYTTGQPLAESNVIDIRPFLRTTELSYNERAAIAASLRPSGSNPFVTESLFTALATELDGRISAVEGTVQQFTAIVQQNTARIDILEPQVSGVIRDVTGIGPAPNSSTGLNHEGRIAQLELALGGVLGSVDVEKHMFIARTPVFESKSVNQIASSYNIYELIPPNHREGLTAVQFTIIADGGGSDAFPATVKMGGGSQPLRTISYFGVAQSSGDLRSNRGLVNTFYAAITKNGTNFTIDMDATGDTRVSHSLYIDGYIVRETIGQCMFTCTSQLFYNQKRRFSRWRSSSRFVNWPWWCGWRCRYRRNCIRPYRRRDAKGCSSNCCKWCCPTRSYSFDTTSSG